MKHGSLFSGIGGFDLAAQWMGWENVFQVELDKFCQKVLEKNFPLTKRYADIKEFDGTPYKGTIDIISGGFPCQPYSVAGNQLGSEDERALWPEMLRTIMEVQPRFIVAENVPGIISISGGMVFQQMCSNLEMAGYEVQPIIIPACGVNAPHKRERIWIVAYSGSDGFKGGNTQLQTVKKNGYDAKNSIAELWAELPWLPNDLPAPQFTGTDDGLPDRMDRIKSLGNAIVPQVVYEIFRAIEASQTKLF